ncbi:hypothetical protein [Pelomonas cellulosilytica]|uniref:PqqD family protein n=1 Tax=Pelomonas cellulosilytica TaxID=2906762 RepID=A0ABS8XLS6_9BURK|nr:hypothetical protein [Pelomonas sp. P8]MCE4553744.1 hypothetical protein [Pelomonas sp. P8]
MPLGGNAQRWRAAPAAGRLLSREFEDGHVCFDPDTGETLLLSHLASFLLEIWSRHPGHELTRADLLDHVLAADDGEADASLADELLGHTLDELQQAGLVARAGDSAAVLT